MKLWWVRPVNQWEARMSSSISVDEIAGIGEATTRRLETAGIRFVDDLLTMPANSMARYVSENCRLPAERILNRFIPQARLLLLR